jgi:hypothetical protein
MGDLDGEGERGRAIAAEEGLEVPPLDVLLVQVTP